MLPPEVRHQINRFLGQQYTFVWNIRREQLEHISNLPPGVEIQYPVKIESPTPDDVAPSIEQLTEAAKSAIKEQVMPSFKTHGYSLHYVRTEVKSQHLQTVYIAYPIDKMNAMWIGSATLPTWVRRHRSGRVFPRQSPSARNPRAGKQTLSLLKRGRQWTERTE